MEKTEKFVLEITYDDEICNIEDIKKRIINCITVGGHIREVVSRARLYNYSNRRVIIERDN